MKKIEIRTTAIIALVSAVMLCTMAVAPAMAYYSFDGWPVVTRVSGTVDGGVFHDSEGWAGSTTLTLNTDVPNGTVKYAYLYTGTWCGNPTNAGWVNVTFNGNAGGVFDCDGNELGPIHIRGNADTNPNVWCSGYGKSWWYYNVTDLVIPGTTNTATTSEINGSLDGRVYGIALVVVYEGGDNPKNIQYWVNDGSDGLNYQTPHNTGTTDFPGTVTGSVTDAKLTMVHLTAYSPTCSDCLKFNDNLLDTSCVSTNAFDMHTWDVTNYVGASANDAWFSRGDDPYANVCNAILALEKEAGVPAPVADFAANVTFGIAPLAVHFTNTSTGTITNWKWDFDNNGEIDSEEPNPDYTYTDPGVYTVRLNVTGPGGSDEEIKEDYITVVEWCSLLPTPFLIYGWVNDSDGEQVNDPDVTVTNLNTSETYEVENMTSSNYYQVSTCSDNVSAGDVLRFVAVNETEKNFMREVTVADRNRGGFVQNITIATIPYPDLTVTGINSYHNNIDCPSWFNLSNEINVTVKNNGDAAAGASKVSLYIEGDYGDTAMYYFGKLPVPALGVGESHEVTFTDWVPIGDDCQQQPCNYMDSYKDYNFTAVADCDGEVEESDETNNATTTQDKTCYNGYTGDEPLENVEHGMLHGRVHYTTGNGSYGGLYSVGDSRTTGYNITIPAGASVEFAHLNVYYTWHYEKMTCPQMEVTFTNTTSGTVTLPFVKAYNDLKCTCPDAAWIFPWGNYVYDLTDYIPDGGEFSVTVTRTGGPSFCIAAPGVDLVYADENAPLIEYWINEGADILLGGRRYPTSSNLAWWECMNNATFQASTETGKVVSATVGVATPWGDDVPDDILFFNDAEIGRGVYDGYGSPCSYTIDSLTMKIEGSNAQVGINVSNVTDLYLQGGDNMVSQADDGDNVMAGNAILVVEYEIPTEVITTYDFATNASIDRWAYRYQINNTNPPATNDVPGVEFATNDNPKKDQYVKISIDNRKAQSDSTNLSGYYAAHRFVFDIADKIPAENIVKIEALWNGKGTHIDRKKAGATLYIWNGTAYEPLNTTDSRREVYLTGDVTAGIGNYIDTTGNLTILVEQNYNQTVKGKKDLVSKLSTDYVKVDITHT